MPPIDMDHDDASFCHEVELTPLDTVVMTEDLHNSLDEYLAGIEDGIETLF